ncbi:PAS domain-containing protein [Roseovarius sp. SCSIO 43702]|uniref:sensor histidine kinase n=1 Tax=Roseovarius sp. SCSIO 43702 TaxID=2823043 RepID=UPI001C73A2D4|nr:HWE histidine kinase domain-containing protein [Roseovarius sp. SCSIO 43702]QYX57847.1 PAS domain-containing protein [Roseovarius sp. SCSIO 43702]
MDYSRDEFIATGHETLEIALDRTGLGVWEHDLRTGTARRNLAHDRIFGYPRGAPDWTMERAFSHLPEPEDHARFLECQQTAIRTGKGWTRDWRIRRVDGALRWVQVSGRVVQAEDGAPRALVGTLNDITEAREADERAALRLREMDHRLANTLAMISSMVSMSARNAVSVDDLSRTIRDRIAAFARTSRMGHAEDTPPPSLSARIEAQAAPFLGAGHRFDLTPPKRVLTLADEAADGLTLVLHELFTNAVKYGAFSVGDGTIRLSVRQLPDGGARLDWCEEGGPPAPADRRSGFGTALMSTALGELGSIDTGFGDEGFSCRITLSPAAVKSAD